MPKRLRLWAEGLVRASIRRSAAAGGVYLVTFLLLALAHLDSATRIHRLPVRIEPLADVLDRPAIEIRAEADRPSFLQLEVNGRRLPSFRWVDPQTEEPISVSLPAGTRELRAVVFADERQEIGSVEIPIRWAPGAFPVEARFCRVATELGLVWIAGTGTPGERLRVLGEFSDAAARELDEDGPGGEDAGPDATGLRQALGYIFDPHEVKVDDFGVFDLFTAPRGALPSRVYLIQEGRAVPSASVECEAAPEGERFPLSREVEVDLEHGLTGLAERAASSFGAEGDRVAAELYLDLTPQARVVVALPIEHPYVERMTSGLMPAMEFVERTVGELDVLEEPWLIKQIRVTLRRAGLPEPGDLEPHARLWLDGTSARVRVDLRLQTFSLWEQEIRWSAGPSSGITARPWLTRHDSISLRTAPEDHWVFEAIPSSLRPEAVAWKGPLELDRIVASRTFPAALRERLTARRSDEPKAEARNMREFLQTLERVERLGVWRHAWITLLAVTPAASILWLLGWRWPFARMAGRSRLLAFAAIAVVLFTVTLIERGLLEVAHPVLGAALFRASAFRPAQDFEEAPSVFDLQEIATGIPSDAFWLAVAAFIGAVPWYLSGLGRRLAKATAGHLPLLSGSQPLGLLRPLFTAGVLALLWVLSGWGLGPAEPVLASAFTAGTDRLSSVLADMEHLSSALASGPELLPASLLLLLVAAALLVAAGWRGVLFAASFWLATAWVLLRRDLDWSLAPQVLDLAVLVVAGLAAALLLSQLLGALVPVPWRCGGRSGAALSLAAAALFLHALSPRLPLIAGAGAVGMGLLWAIFAALVPLGPRWASGRFRPRSLVGTAVLLGIFALAGIGLGYLHPARGDELEPAYLSSLLSHWRKVLPPLLGVGLALLLWRRLRSTERRILSSSELVGAAVLYAVFLVSPTTTWLGFIPVPLLVAAGIARYGLFMPEADRAELRPLDRPGIDTRELAGAYVEAAVPRRRVDAAVQSLTKALEQAKLTPREYEDRVGEYRRFWKESRGPEPSPAAFALGDRDFTASVLAFVGIGLLLASVPIVISLYQYLPVSQVSRPYPVADFVTFLLAAVLKWGLYAAFFGLLFASLRGRTGLTKGLHLFLAIGIPFVAYHLLRAPSLEELRSFGFWISQLFVFFGLLGVLAGDLRLLRLAGVPANRLRLVHRLPALYAFASTVTAALVPTLVAALAGRFGDIVEFFMELVIPAAGSS